MHASMKSKHECEKTYSSATLETEWANPFKRIVGHTPYCGTAN